MSDYCPNCESKLEDFVEGLNMGQRCPNCGWSLVTTFIPSVLDDEEEYTISLLEGNAASLDVLRAVTQLAGCNFITAKRMLTEAPVDLYTGQASDVLTQKNTLENAGVLFDITPAFPYSSDGQSNP